MRSYLQACVARMILHSPVVCVFTWSRSFYPPTLLLYQISSYSILLYVLIYMPENRIRFRAYVAGRSMSQQPDSHHNGQADYNRCISTRNPKTFVLLVAGPPSIAYIDTTCIQYKCHCSNCCTWRRSQSSCCRVKREQQQWRKPADVMT